MTRTVVITMDKQYATVTARVFFWTTRVVLDYTKSLGYHVRKGYRAGPITSVTAVEFERLFGWRPERGSKHTVTMSAKIKT